MTYQLSPDDIRRCRAINMRYRDRIKDIALAVAAETSIPVSSIYGVRKSRPIVEARWIVMRLAAEAGISQEQIGVALNRDHTTVSHGIRQEKLKRARMEGVAG